MGEEPPIDRATELPRLREQAAATLAYLERNERVTPAEIEKARDTLRRIDDAIAAS